MTTPADYSPEELALLIETPFAVGMAVMMAAESGLGTVSEVAALHRLILSPAAPLADSPFLRALLNSLRARSEADPRAGRALINPFEGVPRPAMGTVALAKVRRALALLEAKATSADIVSYRQWLLAIGRGVAQAAKEGAVFGLGGRHESAAEEAFLSELEAALHDRA
jgi:hypothetical protein